jgi:MscS family membrane protein
LSSLILSLSATIIVILVDFFVTEQIGITGKVYNITEISLQIFFLIFVLWSIFACGRIVAELIIASPKIDSKGIYATLIKMSLNIGSCAIALTILFHGLSKLGVSLLPVLTGLGVGGLAVALAARPTIENFIGGIMILLDRPYRVGQRIKVKDHDGFVEHIGLRSTKIRLLTGSQTTIPNEEMARAEIENIERRPYIRRLTNITIMQNTPLEKVDRAVDIIKNILDNHEGMNPDLPPRVFFNDFNPDSLNILMVYWYHPSNMWEFQSFNQIVNRQIMLEFNKEGIKFSLPTTTTYLAQGDDQQLSFTVSEDSSLPDLF